MIIIWRYNTSRTRLQQQQLLVVVLKTSKVIATLSVLSPIRVIMPHWCPCLSARLQGVPTSWTIMTRTSLSLRMINRLIIVVMYRSILPLPWATLSKTRDGRTTSQLVHLLAVLPKLYLRLVLFNHHRLVQGFSKLSLRSHHLLTGPSLRCLARN